MDKVRFGVVGTNFISDWVIAGARRDQPDIRVHTSYQLEYVIGKAVVVIDQ